MKLDSERIELLPLTAKQLRLLVDDINALEQELNCIYCGEPIMGSFIDFIKTLADKIDNDELNRLYRTLWLIVRKEDSTVVGEISFKGTPYQNNEVEIGYGLNPRFQGNGYMTEAVNTLCNWALLQSDIHHVLAETDNNEKSENILKRAGFVEIKRNDTSVYWRK